MITQVMGAELVVYTVGLKGLNSMEGLRSLLVLPLSVWALRFHPVIKALTGVIFCNYHQTVHSSVRMLRRR